MPLEPANADSTQPLIRITPCAMSEPLEVKALPDSRIWIRHADGKEGEVDLSYLAGQGMFKIWGISRSGKT